MLRCSACRLAQREFAKFVHGACEGRLRTCSPRMVAARPRLSAAIGGVVSVLVSRITRLAAARPGT